ncbi:MAG: extracellular solute-binding protein [Patescibacteria group bacterium]|jgi:multiple sugar transport system substrate-binding protein|nr:extracellular solute-binding protein [Patescibacteria group bacterium]MDD3777817.1 extracellular solute-binding protein [Patescibacteria group bacterium]MDD3939486.1 extracellular solute-binding protein [Patescibacteria group bacterium]MDD4443563.1 extracellular solute-binding protein [Patescibacteria group bacterium]NCU39740.1 extracellular solute-binding protein [Candidatus Falkowbacteria bacterium]
MRKKISFLILLAIFLISSGFGCKVNNGIKIEKMEPVTLSYWRVFEGPDAFDEIIKKYTAMHPSITIDYRKLRYEEYEQELLNALAEDRGPDIFSIHNTWIRKYQTKIEPMPDSTAMVYPVEKGSIKKEIVYEMRTTPSISLREIRDNFVDVVSGDVVLEDNKVYGLPLSVDTLAMFYNKDLLNNAGISEPPKYWNREFLQAVKKLTKQDAKKGLIQSGVAMGSSDNIERFSDILSLLMIQNGATMINDDLKVSFQLIPEFAKETNYNPGLEALRFYTDFANPTKESYAWNNEMNNSLEMFINGNLALMFGYAYHIPTIKTAAPKLNFSVSKFPQIEGNPPTNINFANYWVETVSKKSKHKNEAWDFIQFMTKAEQAKTYLAKTQKPTALRSLVSEQIKDDVVGVFADQVLTAKSWYKGRNVTAAELAFKEMIDNVLNTNTEDMRKIITNSAVKVQQTIY